ncbi:MAG: class I tRNA ligase family protein, partial [Rhizomicrobium sp.]
MSNPPKNEAPAQDYRASLFLPATDFPMKAGLPEAEPKWLARWDEIGLYGKMRDRARGRSLFVLHDGPIYANGDIHSGTGLNHILKDFVVRSQGMLGKDAPYVPGWDCHGLPIEWKVEEQYRAEGKSKDDVPTDVLRRDCRVFASHWLNVQREQIKRLGQIGDFERPYTTMNFRAEAVIAREAMKFIENGLLYRGFRPVMWSPVEKTALADAEVEYHEKSSPAIYVKFPITKGGLEGFVVIWTTTPWTIPGNRAIAFSPEISYGLYQIADAADGSLARPGEQILLADLLAEDVAKQAKMMLSRVRTVEQGELAATICAHPFRSLGYDFEVPLLAGDHVTADAGTGFVHTAPGHGEDDFELMTSTFQGYAAKNPDAFSLIEPDGSYGPKVPYFAGKKIL